MLARIGMLGIFIICAQAVVHFSPSQTYTKYLKLLLSIMVLVQLLQPVLSFLIGNDDFMNNLAGQLSEDFEMHTDEAWIADIESQLGYEEQIAQILDYGLQAYGAQYTEESLQSGKMCEETTVTPDGGGITPVSIQVEDLPMVSLERNDAQYGELGAN